MESRFLREYTVFGHYIRIIDDGAVYPYGTKQRIVKEYVAAKVKEGYREFLYCGPAAAMGAYALAAGCVANNVRCTLFLVGTDVPPQGRKFPRNLVDVRVYCKPMYEVEKYTERYLAEDRRRLLIPFGINDGLYKELLHNSLLSDTKLQPIIATPPSRMWLAAGSGTLLSIFLKIFPDTHFNVVQVGKTVYLDNFITDPQELELAQGRVTFFWAPEKFAHSARMKPPYSSLHNYDAKIWQFLETDGQSGDCIWNVARDYPNPPRSRGPPNDTGSPPRSCGPPKDKGSPPRSSSPLKDKVTQSRNRGFPKNKRSPPRSRGPPKDQGSLPRRNSPRW